MNICILNTHSNSPGEKKIDHSRGHIYKRKISFGIRIVGPWRSTGTYCPATRSILQAKSKK